ncbi:hemolysin [Bacteroidia bacterium]|nr:hemolysin [Bacteroidia bacterium]
MNEEDNIELRSEEFQEVLGNVPPWILRWGITLIALILLLLLTGSVVIQYPDTISARIVLTGSIPPATVTARASGKLKELFVRDNQAVNAGDYLAVIDNPARTEDVLKLKAFVDGFAGRDAINRVSTLPPRDLRLGTLQTAYSNFYITLFNWMEYNRLLYYPQKIRLTKDRIVQYEEQYRNLQRQQTLTKEQFVLNRNQFRRDSTLFSAGVISREEFEKSQNNYLQSKLSEENMHSTLNNMRIQIAQLKEQLLDAGQKDTETLNGLQTQLQSLTTQLQTEIQSWELAYVLLAPVDGKITFTNFWVSNQNVTTGEAVFTIIPTRPVVVIGKATLPVARSGKVEAGQKVNIRLENFPENEFGIVRGRVQSISLVPVQTGEMIYYTVDISLPDRLTTTYRKELPYLPNMQGQADIITDDISLLERLILPVKKILKESL